MALPLLHAGTGAGGVPDVGALKWSSGGAFVWSDDNYIVPSLDLNFALFKDLRPRIGPTPSFTRASTGTYFNSSGVLTTAAINGPRFDHAYNGSSWVSKGLLMEEQRTNLLLFSEDISYGGWTKTDASVSVNSGIAPDGNMTADKLVENTASGVAHRMYYSLSMGTSSTFSAFFKAAGRNYVMMMIYSGIGKSAYFDILNGSVVSTNTPEITAKVQPVGNGWFRCSVTYSGSFGPSFVQIHMSQDGITDTYTGDGTSGMFIWGLQAENNVLFPTSYIPTTTAAVTRSADVCQITGTDFSGFWNASESSLAVEYDLASTIPAQAIFYANDGTVSNCFRLYVWLFTLGSPSTDFYSRTASVTDGTIVLASTSPSAGKVAIGQKLNDLAGSLNGAAVVTDTSVVMPTGLSRLDLGIDHIGTRMNGHLARLRYYNTRLTNSQLQVLST